MLTSSRTIPSEQTKNQANMGIAINVGALIGVVVWGASYDATATGLEAEKPLLHLIDLHARMVGPRWFNDCPPSLGSWGYPAQRTVFCL